MGSKNLRPNNDVISRQVGEERVLVHLQSNEMYSLNSTGARAWELLSEGQDEEGIAATLCDEYGIDRAEAHRELETLLDDLERHHLVERA
jgi:Coenzyme PQQ synthesis protein D (PqqD)